MLLYEIREPCVLCYERSSALIRSASFAATEAEDICLKRGFGALQDSPRNIPQLAGQFADKAWQLSYGDTGCSLSRCNAFIQRHGSGLLTATILTSSLLFTRPSKNCPFGFNFSTIAILCSRVEEPFFALYQPWPQDGIFC